jgi:hypothetical protein
MQDVENGRWGCCALAVGWGSVLLDLEATDLVGSSSILCRENDKLS